MQNGRTGAAAKATFVGLELVKIDDREPRLGSIDTSERQLSYFFAFLILRRNSAVIRARNVTRRRRKKFA
jgi:hypothetical protein